MSDNDKFKLVFSKKDLKLISHALYQTYNHMIYSKNVSDEDKEISAGLQRMINPLLQEY